MDQQHLDALRSVRAGQLDRSRPDVVDRVHAGGRLTARERVDALVDAGSTVEYGGIAARTADGTWIAEAGGVDFVATVAGRTVITSSTDATDKGGGYGAGRLPRLFALADQYGWPMVLFVDGGGSRARHPRVGLGHIETTGAIGPFNLFDGISELSGRVPTVAIVSGPAFAGHASLAGFSDVVITTPGSAIGMGGPPMVEAALGKKLTPNELAGVEMHDVTGGIDVLVADEHAAIQVARRYLAFLDDEPVGTPSPSADRIAELVPDEGPYDVQAVIEALVDADSALELRRNFARSVVTVLARIDGRTVGVVASQPLVDDGAIDGAAATKIGRFVELCDAYDYPLVALVDTPGCVIRRADPDGGPDRLEPGVDRWHTRVLLAHHHRTIPVVSVRLRRGRGLGAALLGGLHNGRTISLAALGWPIVELGRPDGFGIVYDHNVLDDVIDPSETRGRIAALLARVPAASPQRRKKHPVDTW